MGRYVALKNLYMVEKTIGSGGFAKVKLATHILTGEKVAIKIMDKTRLGNDLPRIKLEMQALKTLSHHHISKLYQVIETQTHFYMVMEYCSGGELFDHIVERTKLSEMEARSFFRQILSAVAYLHSAGYAHRDLKPENVLLDKDQTLKLIDFGLCAKPSGGLQTLLFTSCGSPTYAAPELIRGLTYFGSEVDVWSMGVLLYALLCGFLPFDAENIDLLYKKILNGKYQEPPWLSEGSRKLLKQMLQTNKDRRITVTELLNHPWITLGYNEPVNFQPIYKMDERDETCVRVMAAHYKLSPDEMWNRLSKWNYDYCTATYMILLSRKRQGQTVRLLVSRIPCVERRKPATPPVIQGVRICESSVRRSNQENYAENRNYTPCTRGRIEERKHTPGTPPVIQSVRICPPSVRVPFLEENKVTESGLQEKHDKAPLSPATPLRKLRKRHRSPGPDDASSPVPAKVAVTSVLKLNNGSREKGGQTERSPTPSNYFVSPSSKILGSIEKSFNKVRNVLTPTKRRYENKLDSANQEKPTILTAKNLCNVSATSFSCPDFVLNKLKTALASKGIVCQYEGYTIRGKMEEDDKDEKKCKLSFELEVCLVPSPAGITANAPALVVVRRKRLKGDAWCYKKVCEEVLRLTVNTN